jgi:hypothetical protein
MLIRTRIVVLAGFAALGLAAASCAPATSIEQTWRAPDARPGQFRKVATMFISKNEAIRRPAEDKLAARLRSRGIQAVPAYTVVSTEDVKDHAKAIAALRAAGFDSVIAMRVVSKDTQLQYLPGGFDSYWDMAWPDAYWDYGYGFGYGGALIPETIVRVETDAYSLVNNQLLWTALSKSVDPDGIRELIDDNTKVVAQSMTRQGLIPPPRRQGEA